MNWVGFDEEDNKKSIIMKPRRVYKCSSCGLISPRGELKKDKNGIRYCRCGSSNLTDITNTITGHDLMEIIGL